MSPEVRRINAPRVGPLIMPMRLAIWRNASRRPRLEVEVKSAMATVALVLNIATPMPPMNSRAKYCQ